MRLKMHGLYNHFPRHNPVIGEPYIDCYNDRAVMEKNKPDRCVALLIEPRSLIPDVYAYVENHADEFKLIFTHDSILLTTLPNARLILYGGVWGANGETQADLWGQEKTYEPMFNDVKKTKDISFCSSDKSQCYLHRVRQELFRELRDEVDCMGTCDGGKRVSTYDIYAEYRFSVVIENYIDDFWFTEKICNAFANQCVPIYYGARNIDRLFASEGIIRVNNLYELPQIIKNLKYDINWSYGSRNKAVFYNFEKVKDYANFEDWFFDRWNCGGVLDEL